MLSFFKQDDIGKKNEAWVTLEKNMSKENSSWQGPKRDEFASKILNFSSKLEGINSKISSYNGNVVALNLVQSKVEKLNGYRVKYNQNLQKKQNLNNKSELTILEKGNLGIYEQKCNYYSGLINNLEKEIKEELQKIRNNI